MVVVDASDNYQLVPMLEQVKDNLGEVAQQTVADAGYVAITEMAKAETQQLPVVVNLPESLQESADQPYHATHLSTMPSRIIASAGKVRSCRSIRSNTGTKPGPMTCGSTGVGTMKRARCVGSAVPAKRDERFKSIRITMCGYGVERG